MTIWLVTGILVYEAINRIFNPVPVNGKRECSLYRLFGTQRKIFNSCPGRAGLCAVADFA